MPTLDPARAKVAHAKVAVEKCEIVCILVFIPLIKAVVTAIGVYISGEDSPRKIARPKVLILRAQL